MPWRRRQESGSRDQAVVAETVGNVPARRRRRFPAECLCLSGRPLVLLQFTARGRTGADRADRSRTDHRSQAVFAKLRSADTFGDAELTSGRRFGSNGQRIRRFRFAGGDVHYANLGEIGLAPAWWAGDKQFVVALSPQNIKAYLSRGTVNRSLADLPEVAAELSGHDPLLAIGYLDAPRLFEAIYPLLLITAPAYLGANGLSEGRREMSMIPSLPSVCQHLRPGVSTLRRTDLGLEISSRGSLPGFGMAAPVMFLAWDSAWLNLVFGESENNAPPIPVVPGAGPAGPVAPPAAPALPPAQPPPAPAK